MPERPPSYVAVDLGAESGRVLAATVSEGRLLSRELHRFAHSPVQLPDGLHWDLTGIFAEVLEGIRIAAATGPVAGIGIDAWGVDYGLLDADGRLLGLPYHYRDRRTEGMVARAAERLDPPALYAATGIQTMPINTVFQLLAASGSPALDAAQRLLLVPDLIAFWLTGRATNEATAASTTGLLDARGGGWAWDEIAALGLPQQIFGETIEPGTEVGPLLDEHAAATGAGRAPVVAVAGHDTASAFAAVPPDPEGRTAILSSGTWSLLGVELPEPVLDERARAFNLTNERGVGGTTRLLRNVIGLWLVQECRAAWAEDPTVPTGYQQLAGLAAAAPTEVPLFDPDDEELLAPGTMPARIAAACERAGQAPPSAPGTLLRSVVTSLACKYRLVLERIEMVTGRSFDRVRVIGGGSRNEFLCRISADLLGRQLLAGPAEATALGNALVLAHHGGAFDSLAEARAAAAGEQFQVFEPNPDRAPWEDLYARFLDLTTKGER